MKIFMFLLLLCSATSAASGDMFKGKVRLDENAVAEGKGEGEERRNGGQDKEGEEEEAEKAIVKKHSEMFVGVNFIAPDGTHHTVDAVDYCKQNKWCNQQLYQP